MLNLPNHFFFSEVGCFACATGISFNINIVWIVSNIAFFTLTHLLNLYGYICNYVLQCRVHAHVWSSDVEPLDVVIISICVYCY